MEKISFEFGCMPEIFCVIEKNTKNNLEFCEGEYGDSPDTLFIESSSYEELIKFIVSSFDKVEELADYHDQQLFLKRLEEAYIKTVEHNRVQYMLDIEVKKLLEA